MTRTRIEELRVILLRTFYGKRDSDSINALCDLAIHGLNTEAERLVGIFDRALQEQVEPPRSTEGETPTQEVEAVLKEYRLLKSSTLHYPAETALTALARSLAQRLEQKDSDMLLERDRAESAEHRIAELQADAERYRKHRRTAYLFEVEHGSNIAEERFNERFDADIDRGDEI